MYSTHQFLLTIFMRNRSNSNSKGTASRMTVSCFLMSPSTNAKSCPNTSGVMRRNILYSFLYSWRSSVNSVLTTPSFSLRTSHGCTHAALFLRCFTFFFFSDNAITIEAAASSSLSILRKIKCYHILVQSSVKTVSLN